MVIVQGKLGHEKRERALNAAAANIGQLCCSVTRSRFVMRASLSERCQEGAALAHEIRGDHVV
jgi:hypothetical protein